jgi:hypothetical protein
MSITAYIYAIVNNDEDITESYVGYTTSGLFEGIDKFWYEYDNPNSHNHNRGVYQYIRSHGGRDDWHDAILEVFDYDHMHELHARVQYWMDQYPNLLNTREAVRAKHCPHGRVNRSRCKPCGGSGICVHGKHRVGCAPCGGVLMCTHGTRKRNCKICNPVRCEVCNIICGGKDKLRTHVASKKHQIALGESGHRIN